MSGRDYYSNKNQYLVEPKDHEKFYPSKVTNEVRKILKENLDDFEIDDQSVAMKTEELTSLIRNSVKENLNLPRYKLVVQVVLGLLKGQGIRFASKCLWDTNSDNFASYTYKNDEFFCTAIVFGLYKE